MKFVYIANVRIPTEKAHGLAIMKMCEALAQTGAKVELFVPRIINQIKEDPFDYYGVERNFRINKLPTIYLMPLFGRLGFFLEAVSFAQVAFWYCLFRKADIFYGRDELSLSLISFFRKHVIWEAHTAKKKWLVGGLLERCEKLVVISGGLKMYYASLGVPEEKIIVAPSGVDMEHFNISLSKKEAREKVDLPQDKKIVMYAGHAYPWKGVDLLRKAAASLPEDSRLVIVSGKKHSEIPIYLKAADVLILPNSGREAVSRLYTSPMKLFEYMASARPIVASDVPSSREILDDSTAYFFRPDDEQSLLKEINRALSNPQESTQKAERAFEIVKAYSWQQRASTIARYMQT